MTFTEMIRDRHVSVDDKPVTVPEETTGAELISAAGQDPAARQLAIGMPDGKTQIVPAEARIKLHGDGLAFETQIATTGG